MSAFSEAALERKLSELSNSQQSVQTLSLWLIHHRKHSALIVSVWERELRKGEAWHGRRRRRRAFSRPRVPGRACLGGGGGGGRGGRRPPSGVRLLRGGW